MTDPQIQSGNTLICRLMKDYPIGQSLYRFHIFQHINPTIKIILTFRHLFLEEGQLQIHQSELVGEYLLALLVHQHHVRPELLADVRPSKIQEGDPIDTLDVVLPIWSFLSLSGDGFRDVVSTCFD